MEPTQGITGGEERRLYELSYMMRRPENEEAISHAEHRVRETVEREGGIIQDAQSPKQIASLRSGQRDVYRGIMHFIAAPSTLARMERATSGLTDLERVLFVRWERTVQSRHHAFMREQPASPSLGESQGGPAAKETPSEVAEQIDKKLDELLKI